MSGMQKYKTDCLTKKESLLSSNNHLLIFLLLSLILAAPTLNAQIKIEERVEIAPKSYKYETDNPILNHIIQLDVQWNQPQYNAAIVGVNVPCQNASAGWQNGGTISLTINNAMDGFYRLQPRFNTPSGVMTHVTYQLFLDGTQVLSGQRDVPGGFSGGSYPYFNIEYTPPLSSSFGLNLQNNTSCIFIPTPIAVSASGSCATGYSWYRNTEPLNLTFTAGGEYASFYNDGQKIGDSYSGTLSEIQHVNVIQDKVYTGSENIYYVVQGDWAGVVRKDSVRIISQVGNVIIADTEGKDSIYSGQRIQVMIYPKNFGGQCSGIFFPYDITYNAEIISGSQFGNLIGGFPEQRGQVLTGLTHWYGMSAFNYIADGISADSIETVTIRISTSDPEVPYIDLTLYIKPSPIYAYTVPEVLGANEEAEVIIKKRNPDGTLEDFPPNQTFELAVLDGCVNGNFMVDGVIDVYFADALQPIKFVTADSIDSEFDKVLLRVGTDLSGFNRPVGNIPGEEEKKRAEYESRIVGATGKTLKELREGFEKMIAEAKAEAEANTKQGGEPMFPVVPECASNSSSYLTYYDFNANVQDEWCEDLNECDEIEFPNIELDVHENNWQNLNVCEDNDLIAGTDFFTSDNSNYREDFEIELCKEEGSDKVQFIFDDDIEINCVSDMCEDHISDGQDILIGDVYSFPETMTCDDKIFWIKLHKNYPYPTKIITPKGTIESVYVIRDIWMRHEEVHRDHFLEVAEGFKEEYLIKIKETIKQCSDFSEEEAAKSFFKNKAEEIIKDFYDATLEKDNKISSGGGNYDKMIDFERNTIHQKVIDVYLQPKIDRWELNNCVD